LSQGGEKTDRENSSESCREEGWGGLARLTVGEEGSTSTLPSSDDNAKRGASGQAASHEVSSRNEGPSTVVKQEDITPLSVQADGAECSWSTGPLRRSSARVQVPPGSAQSPTDGFPSSEAALQALSHAKLTFCTGPLAKALGRRKGPPFSLVTLGHRHVHLLDPEHGLFDAAGDGAMLLIESCTYMLQLTSAQVTAYSSNNRTDVVDPCEDPEM
jgi:hypothetical protein